MRKARFVAAATRSIPVWASGTISYNPTAEVVPGAAHRNAFPPDTCGILGIPKKWGTLHQWQFACAREQR